MILRSLHVVGFRGEPEWTGAMLPEQGVVRLVLPAGAAAGSVAAALAWAFTGRGTEDVAPRGSGRGFAHVEIGFRTDDGKDASLFRGVDHRNQQQVSLREDAPRRVTGGEAAVAQRLAELLGMAPDQWCERAIGVEPPDADDAPPEEPAATPSPAPGAGALAAASRSAVQELRRVLRAERLRLLASRHHAELLELGRRLRHERGAVAREVDRLHVERDRVRTRLRRVNEYRDQLARAAAGEPAPEDSDVLPAPSEAAEPPRGLRGDGAIELTLVGCAAGTFLALVLYSSTATGDPDRSSIQIGLGLGFLVAVASYLHVAGRRPVTSPAGDRLAAAPAGEAERRPWKEALRRRFADLGDPDDPALPGELRTRLTELDAAVSPLHGRLERLDDAIAIFDVEAGRAARALHESLPELVAGGTGLAEGAEVAAAVASVHALGDAVYASVVERDVLLGEGTADPAAARQALAVALDALGDSTGAPGAATALLRRVDSFACAVGDEPEEDQLADLLDAEIARIASGARPSPVRPRTAPAAPRRPSGLVVPRGPAGALDDGALVRLFGPRAQIVVGDEGSGTGHGDRVLRADTSQRRS